MPDNSVRRLSTEASSPVGAIFREDRRPARWAVPLRTGRLPLRPAISPAGR
jgi:hypothetical protein